MIVPPAPYCCPIGLGLGYADQKTAYLYQKELFQTTLCIIVIYPANAPILKQDPLCISSPPNLLFNKDRPPSR